MKKACIIGAGSSGIAAAKVLHERNLPFDCFEKGSQIGGNWRFENDNNMSSAYASLHINTSKGKMAYSDFPMPDHYPQYSHHSQIIEYFESYVDHFGFRDNIRFQTAVKDIAPAENGHWRVTLDNGDSEIYQAVLVANGHHWKPRYPDFPGKFDGQVLHSHYYRRATDFEKLEEKNVLFVGIGNSAMDMSSEISQFTKRTFVSTRRGAHIMPRYLFGKPIDSFVSPAGSYAPQFFQRLVLRTFAWIANGSQESYGVPKPRHNLSQAHPTLSSEFLVRVGHGDICMKPNIAKLHGNAVEFEDGSTEQIDILIYATGYDVCFPFIKNEILDVQNNEVPLYLHVVPPFHKNLFFLGLIQPLGAIMPLAELQSKWIAELLTDESELPSPEEMNLHQRKEQEAIRKRYVTSTRHTMQVDFYPYVRAVRKEMKAGGRRASRKRALQAENNRTGHSA